MDAATLVSTTQSQTPALPYLPTRRTTLLCVALIFGVAGILDLIVASSMSRTVDEEGFISYGIQILHSRSDRSAMAWWNSKTPVSALNAAPQAAAGLLQRHHAPSRLVGILRELRIARVPSVIAFLLLNWFVFLWVSELYGTFAALAASIMVALSPNLIAHGTLVTSDGYFCLGVIASLYFFRQYLLQPTWRNAWLSGLMVALAQLTKPFAIYLFLVMFAFLALRVIRKSGNVPRLPRKSAIAYLVITGVLCVVVLNVGYAFDRSLVPLKSYEFRSVFFQKLQSVPLLRRAPVPLPYAVLQGMDMMKHDDDARETFGNIYLLGELRRVHDRGFRPFKSYYLVALFFKEPIALQILFVVGLFVICRNRRRDDFLAGEGLLLAASVTLFLWQSFFRNSQLGIRCILPVLAIEIIIAASVFANFPLLTRGRKAVLVGLLVWLAVSTFSYFPHMIPYMNEWVLDRKSAYKILADSNLDWGQNQELVQQFLSKNPDVTLNPEHPVTGRVLVNVNRLVGTKPQYAPMTWLLQYRPVAQVGYADLLYNIPISNAPR